MNTRHNMAVIKFIVNFRIPFTVWVKDALYSTASFARVPFASQIRSPLTNAISCNCFATTNVPKSELEHCKLSRAQFAIIIRSEDLSNHMSLHGTPKVTQRHALRIIMK